MEIDNGGVAGIFNQQAPDLPLAATPSPFPTRAQGLVLAPLTVNTNTKHKAAAFTFYKWVLQPENQKQLQDLLGASNVATIVQRSPEDLAKKPWLKVYDEQTPNSIPQLVQGFELKTPEIQQIVLEHVLKVLQGGADPKKMMDDAQQQAARQGCAQVDPASHTQGAEWRRNQRRGRGSKGATGRLTCSSRQWRPTYCCFRDIRWFRNSF